MNTKYGKCEKTSGRAVKRVQTFGVFLFLSGILMLSSCAAVGPNYKSPTVSAPDAWHSELEDGLQAETVRPEILAEWWAALQDPVLSDLIGQALAANLNLKKAQARVREARARRGIREAGFFPSLDAGGSVTRWRSSKNNGTGETNTLYAAGFDAGWEIDIFGGVRRSVEAADADLQASGEALRNVLVSLMAEVALNYVESRTYQTRLDVAGANLHAQQETFNLIQSRYQAGLSNELAVQQARYNLENTRSQVPTLRTGLEAALNRLAVLTGQTPGAVHGRMADYRPIPVPPATVAVGVPAETLRRRPDIRKAERELAAETARIGIATAELYPKFRLAGSIGLESLKSTQFFKSASHFWSLIPGFSWKIFHAGAIRRNIEAQTAVREQYLIAYEAAVLNALEEVENTLTAYVQEQLRRMRLLEAVDAAKRAEGLARDQYQAGLVDFANVLDAQRSLLSFEDQLARSNGLVTGNLISLYKALGGGWKPME